LEDPSQPRVCALAASLTNEEGEIIDEMDVLIKPDGWVIEPGAAAINGLTVERCEVEGIPMNWALERFNEMKAQCQTRIAANVSFDKQMMFIEAHRHGIPHDSEGKEELCVLNLATPYAKVPYAGGKKGFKRPKLTEAYKAIIGEDMPNAHSAMGDVRACQAIYFEIMRRLRGVEGVA
jgi:DNA polymerase-3 subunit epsilon